MFLHQSAYLDWNLHHAGYPGHTHQEWKIQRCEGKYVNIHIPWVIQRFGTVELGHWCRVASALQSAVCFSRGEVHQFRRVSSLAAVSMRWHFGNEGIRPGSSDEALPVVFLLHPPPYYALQTQLPPSSLRGLQRKVSCSDVVLHQSQCTKTLRWPFWSYSWPGACRTDPAVPDLIALL